jgi:chromosome segregation ATPase
VLLWNAAANALAAKDREIEQLREKVDLYKDRAEESMRLWTENRSRLQDRIEELFVERDEAMREITELREERDASNDQIAAKDAEITEHQRHVAAVMQREANAIAEIERQRLSHTHYYDKYHSALAERDALAVDFDNERYKTSALEREIERLRDEIKKLNVAWQTSEFGCTNLRAERDEARRVARVWYNAAGVWKERYEANDVDAISDELMMYCQPRKVKIYPTGTASEVRNDEVKR